MLPEIDHGPPPTHRNDQRLAMLERGMLNRHRQEQDTLKAARRSTAVRRMILIPLLLGGLALGTLAGLDYAHVINLGWFLRPTATAVVQATPPLPVHASFPPPPMTAPDESGDTVPEASEPITTRDPARIAKLADKLQHLNHGVIIIQKEIDEASARIRQGEWDISNPSTGYVGQLNSAQAMIEPAYEATRGGGPREIDIYHQWQEEVTRLQNCINSQTDADNQDTDHITSLSGRLDKAQGDLADTYVAYLGAGGTATK